MPEKQPGYKTVRVTGKRQLTIPKKYFDALQIGEKVRCYLEGERLVIEPERADTFWDFSTDILKELVAENYTGEELLREFESRKQKAARAFAQLVAEAKDDASAGLGRPAQDVFKDLADDGDV